MSVETLEFDGQWGQTALPMAVEDPLYSAYVSDNAPVFARVMAQFVPSGSRVADVTYGRGTFWRLVPAGQYHVLASDIRTGVDCRRLPYEDESIDAVVLDPPYQAGLFREAHQTHVTHGDFRDRYSAATPVAAGEPKDHDAVRALYRDAGWEAVRVLRARGALVVKCQDEVVNHRLFATHVEIIQDYAEWFELVSLVVVMRRDRPTMGRWKTQEHARQRHSYFLVFEKLKGVRRPLRGLPLGVAPISREPVSPILTRAGYVLGGFAK